MLNPKYANYSPPHIQQRALEDFGSQLSFLAIDAQKYKLIPNRQNLTFVIRPSSFLPFSFISPPLNGSPR
ncbi:hypothetical protein HMPREF9072_02183 [Capnocytophaga sp. oral taxon 324 str. F0483]|nr:hypothetical protein HMPREF9072_02183 [Capnocytophaga sp. oral taxon 324 str. F0483]